jgi:hypothetical protein
MGIAGIADEREVRPSGVKRALRTVTRDRPTQAETAYQPRCSE